MTAINRLHGGTTEEPGGGVVSVIVYGNCHESYSPKPSEALLRTFVRRHSGLTARDH